MRKILCLSVMLMLAGYVAWAQRTVSGRVTDANNNPVPNASVQIKNTQVGTVSRDDGSFSLTVPANGRVLVISAVGMTTQEITIGSQTNFSVSLQAGNQQNMQEVVVVGYGTQRRNQITSNVSTVKGSVIADKPVQSFDQALAGRAPGVQITVPNGVLNAPPVFRVRGTNSISLSSYPLVVIDGIPSPTGDLSGTNAGGNALSSINPADIESIDIGKDAAATAIYGSRAANGVVFITTKRGRSGKAKISYNANVSWTKAFGIPQVLDAQQYTDYKNMAAANNQNLNTTNPAGAGYVKFATMTDANGNLVNTNWADVVYKTGLSHNHTMSVQGGNDNTTYYFSVGYSDQQGMIRKNQFKRVNGLFNIDSRVNNVLSFGGKLAISNERNLAASTSGSLPGEGFSTGGAGRLVLVNAPNVGVYRNDGSYNIASNNVIGSGNNSVAQVGFSNPQVLFDLNRSNSETNHLQANTFVQIKPLQWLTLRSLFGIDYALTDNDIFWNPIHGDGFAATGQTFSSYSKNKRWTWNSTAQVDYTFASKHSVNLLIGTEQDRRTNEGFGINRQTLSDPAYTVAQAGFGINNPTGLSLGENFLLSSFGRLNYDFNRKYFISVNARQDEYSAFADKKEVFYGFSAGWDITKENFWSNANLDKTFSTFRFRGSYGKVGNFLGIGDFPTYSSYSSGLYGGLATLGFTQAGNPNLSWEISYKTDVGFTAGLFNNRLTTEFAYYYNNVSDLILNVPQSPSTGLPNAIPTNIGAMYNRGFELSITGNPIQGKDFTWTSSFNITTNKNEVTALAPGLREVLTATSGLETVSRTAVGYSLGYLWVVRTGGVDPQTGRRILIDSFGNKVLYQFAPTAGQWNYSNPDGTRYISPKGATTVTQAADAHMVGNVLPRQYGGWDNTFRYKSLDLNVLMTYALGYYVYYGSNAGLHDQRFWNNAIDVLDAWKKPGDVTTVPRPVYNDNVSNGSALPMDYNIFKGDFVKVKNVTLGYTFPLGILSRAKISNARLYVSGQNLAIITDYPGPDPEVSSNGNGTTNQGIDRNTVPNARTFVVGLNIGF